jgi:cation transport regulator ChaC
MAAPVDVFFYGLFMDEGVLKDAGASPRHGRKARLDGFALRIGQRATLVRIAGATAWGMVYALAPDELDRLYRAPGLAHYRPEAVEVALENRAIIAARAYALPQPPAEGERNPEYAERLKAVLTRLGFPAEYIAQIG